MPVEDGGGLISLSLSDLAAYFWNQFISESACGFINCTITKKQELNEHLWGCPFYKAYPDTGPVTVRVY
jgi:hypothetical protein